MPQYTEPPANMTPFAQVLVDFMWNKRPRNSPPLSYAQLAIRLGVPKQSVSNWILRGSVPPLDTIMIILNKLRIPFRDLYDAYIQSNLPVPPWDEEELQQATAAGDAGAANANATADEPVTPRSRKPATAPLSSIPATRPTRTNDAPAPLPYSPPPSVPSQDDEWDRIVAHTEQTLRQEGVSEDAITAVIADLRNRQSSAATPIERNLIAEHSNPSGATDEAQNSGTSTPTKTSKRSSHS